MSARKTIRVDVFSDFTCGWCYFAHRELQQGVALARAANLPADFKIQYHPYMLNSGLPDEAVSRKEYFEAKLGAEKWTAVTNIMIRRAEEEGVKFKEDSPVSSTLRAHRLTQHAWAVGGQNAQQAIISALLQTAFEEGLDIGNIDVLASIALSVADEENGIPPLFKDGTEARTWLASSALAAEVRTLTANAAARGVAGVPCAIFDGRWVVAGSQKPECYFKLFEKIATGHCSGTCPNLPKVSIGNGMNACVKTATVLKADTGTMCGVPAGGEAITSTAETTCTQAPGTAQAHQLQTAIKRDTEITSHPPALRAAVPTAVAI